MRVTYDPQDIQDIARLVAQEVMPRLLVELREALERQAPPVPRPEPPTSVTQSGTAGEVVSTKELRRLIGVSETTLWRLRQGGQFPAPLQLSRNRIGWLRSDIEAWRDSRR